MIQVNSVIRCLVADCQHQVCGACLNARVEVDKLGRCVGFTRRRREGARG